VARPDIRLLAFAACLLVPAAHAADQPRGIPVGDNIFVSCEYRVAAIFPEPPQARDVTYDVAGMSFPAREFYMDHRGGLFSVTVVHFPEGPDEDLEMLEAATAKMQERGEALYVSDIVPYDDDGLVPGRQMAVNLADGRLLRAHVYVARQRLYVTEATSERNDGTAFRFEQSVAFIDETGQDLDSNNLPPGESLGSSSGLPLRQYVCEG